jgi:PleD family two-component response regulator
LGAWKTWQMTTNNSNPTAIESPPNELNNSVVRIMVADDQAANIQIIGNMLGKLGYEIVELDTDGKPAEKKAF